ncbi:winged helix-turn-helix transcriptional regulator [Planctomonas sp. JC2975]|uniref:MarR family winged helix-turn-helix transcriptional regulator n=1 Tax=Planctomonas sp. JC2975 TaxID=2729626 RepID=UPI001474AD8E|nr:MarR family winged helix-turn-helix transcriptional regulator [Planctomonas sp. JC2975]NNC12326.1 winged helix-turn-helix transcriptional regulator [Planctomonas sp. JC2975]
MREETLAVGLLLRQSHRWAAQMLDTALAPLHIGGPHFGVLLLLDRDGSSTHRELIALTGRDKANMARTIADLDALGAIARTVDTADRRVVHVSLTPAGQTLYAEAQKLLDPVSREFERRLGTDGIAQLTALLQRLLPPSPL